MHSDAVFRSGARRPYGLATHVHRRLPSLSPESSLKVCPWINHWWCWYAYQIIWGAHLIQTDRLILRPFREADREPFAAINGDSRVSDWLGGPIDRETSDSTVDWVNQYIAKHGFGFWAAETKCDGKLVGMIGLKHMSPELPPAPALEAGWRLSPECWGQGLAAEGARAALDWGFQNLAVAEIVAITAVVNSRSQAVMRRIGMVEQPERGFDHPALEADHPLRRHVLFSAAP